jgi:hypothetical protein
MLALMVVLVFGNVVLRPSSTCASIHVRCGSHADSVWAGAGAGGGVEELGWSPGA